MSQLTILQHWITSIQHFLKMLFSAILLNATSLITSSSLCAFRLNIHWVGQLTDGQRHQGAPLKRYKDSLKSHLKLCGFKPETFTSSSQNTPSWRHDCKEDIIEFEEAQIAAQGQNFESDLFLKVCKRLSIDKVRTSAYKPSTNGNIERFHATTHSMLAKLISDNQRDWDNYLATVAFAYRTTVNEVTGFMPFFLTYGREARIPADLCFRPPPARQHIGVSGGYWTPCVWDMERVGESTSISLHPSYSTTIESYTEWPHHTPWSVHHWMYGDYFWEVSVLPKC